MNLLPRLQYTLCGGALAIVIPAKHGGGGAALSASFTKPGYKKTGIENDPCFVGVRLKLT